MLKLEEFLEKYIWKKDKFILACSCWPDSMYLLYQILKTKYRENLIVCYFNHKLRKQADKEEKYIEKLWKKLWFIVETWNENIKKVQKNSKSKSLEETAREKRYEFLNLIKEKHNAKYLLTAHHLDDKIETFFFNLTRWSKISGLINMTENSGNILRPLLWITKNEILKYLEKNKIKYFLDKTNLDTKITRNYLRLKILPKFEKINKNYKENIENFMDYLEKLKDFIDQEIIDFLENNKENLLNKKWKNKTTNYFSIKEFNKKSLFFKKELIRYIFYKRNNNSTIWLSEANIDEILKFIDWKNSKTIKEIKNLKMNKDWDKIYY